MKLIIIAKTGKGKDSSDKEIDKTVEIIENLMFDISKKTGLEISEGKCFCDGTQVILEDKKLINKETIK